MTPKFYKDTFDNGRNDVPSDDGKIEIIVVPVDTRASLRKILATQGVSSPYRPLIADAEPRKATITSGGVSREMNIPSAKDADTLADERWQEICASLPGDLSRKVKSLRDLLKQRQKGDSPRLPTKRHIDNTVCTAYEQISLESPEDADEFLITLKDLWQSAFSGIRDFPFPDVKVAQSK